MIKKQFSTNAIIQDAANRIAELAFDIALEHTSKEGRERKELILNGISFRKEIGKMASSVLTEIIQKLKQTIYEVLRGKKT